MLASTIHTDYILYTIYMHIKGYYDLILSMLRVQRMEAHCL